MPREDTQFKKGKSGNPGGRPRKPDNTEKMGKLAWDKACAMLEDPDLRPDQRFQVCKFVVEFAYGKPQQSVDVVADVGEETMDAMRGMGLKERIEAVQAALEAYESTKKN